MKETPIIFNTENVGAILDSRKTMTRRIVTPRNSVVGEGKMDWNKFDFYAQTFLSGRLKSIVADGAEPGSIATVSLKDNGRAPMPWVDNSVSPKYGQSYTWQYLHVPYRWSEDGTIYRIYPRWEVGDRLWVRETFCEHTTGGVVYKADEEALEGVYNYHTWRPSIFMPHWASRITLEITDVRVERLQDITDKDIKAEGITTPAKLLKKAFTKTEMADILRGNFVYLWDSLNAKRGYGWEVNPWVWVLSFRRFNA